MATFCVLLIAFFLPWYHIKYAYTSTDSVEPNKYTASAYIHPFYVYENSYCKTTNMTTTNFCSGHPGSLLKDEGFRLWIGFNTSTFGMKILLWVCWGLMVASMVCSVYLMIRRNKARFVSFAMFMMMILATFFFTLLPYAFFPCEFPGLTLNTGPCDSFFSSIQMDVHRTFSNAPDIGWIGCFLGMFFSSLGLFFSILAPNPDRSFMLV